MGSASYKERLEFLIKRLEIDNNILTVKTVHRTELPNFSNAADFAVWLGTFSISIIEAMACGLPIIISDKSGATERAAFGNGLLYRESDPVDLVRKITLLLDNDLRKTMSERAVTYAKTLCWDNLAARFLGVLKC